MFLFGMKKVKDLDQILLTLQNDAENNYKDAAQASFKKFCNRLDEYIASGKLKEKQINYYKEQRDKWAQQMKNYTHKDQKVTW